MVHLRSGRETVLRLPILPGATAGEIEVPVRADPSHVLIEGRVAALEDEIADEAARRAIIKRRLEPLAVKDQREQADQAMEL
jgi:hypothetical protein